MSVRGQQQQRLSIALAAITCGRLSHAAVVRASRGRCSARADQYGVNVTERHRRSPPGPRLRARELEGERELVLEYWGADAETLAFDSMLKGAARRSDPGERARVAARTIRDYDLDSLEIAYPDGTELTADRTGLVLRGPRRGRLRRRDVLIRVALGELL
ncbi:MAG: hypothetical protein ABSG43_01430 [Solirubrobacteraceae bacterium]